MSKPIQTVEELDAVLHWRGKHAQAIRERDALQQRLTAANERNDLAIDLIRRARAVIEGGGWADLERDIAKFFKPADGDGKPCACPGCDSARRASSPFCVAHRSAKSRTRAQDPLTAEGLEWLMQGDGNQQ
ncbi:hypothetical protein [Pseudomonas sp. 34 E 7]|uniref:hypothetical protein n=1 Tax=Pseudomonas sp. 34 E 7 TaxID=1844102 RepID=UPI0008122000|nr:hypothetical protein [Pseudomonas sp. 34 E 7]CRN02157.1 hypothetical protein [Pseudomonas sp. 34 E 7]